MSQNEKRKVEQRVQPTTLFDFFWRLRVRSNYKDVGSFILSNVGPEWQREFRDSLETIMESTMALLESLLVGYAGPDLLLDACREFSDSHRGDLPELRDPLMARVQVVSGTE